MKKFYGTLLAIMVISALSGCSNTGHGIGKDVENMGKWVQTKT